MASIWQHHHGICSAFGFFAQCSSGSGSIQGRGAWLSSVGQTAGQRILAAMYSQFALVAVSGRRGFLMLPFFSPAVRITFLLSALVLLLVFKSWWIRLLRTRHFFMRQLRALLHQRSNAWGWFWSVANWTIKILVISLMLQNLTGLQSIQTLHGALTGELSALLPLTGPAGFGTYEAGVWTGLGLPWQDIKGFMASIFLTHLFFLIISLMGAGLVLCLEVLDWYPIHSPQEHLHG